MIWLPALVLADCGSSSGCARWSAGHFPSKRFLSSSTQFQATSKLRARAGAEPAASLSTDFPICSLDLLLLSPRPVPSPRLPSCLLSLLGRPSLPSSPSRRGARAELASLGRQARQISARHLGSGAARPPANFWSANGRLPRRARQAPPRQGPHVGATESACCGRVAVCFRLF